jgi:hypothetical protein
MAKNNFNCPHCNQQISITPSNNIPPGNYAPWQPNASFQSTAPGPFAAGGESPVGTWQKVTPISRMQPKDIYTSLLDAGAAFLLVTTGAALICYAGAWPLVTAPGLGLATAIFRYFGGMATAKNLLQVVETWSSESDPATGAPTDPETKSHLITVQVKEGKSWKFAYLGIDPKKLISFSLEVLNGSSFSERTAGSHEITQDEFRALRDEFLKRGWVEWNHPTRPQQGLSLRQNGKAVLRAIASTPPPQDD